MDDSPRGGFKVDDARSAMTPYGEARSQLCCKISTVRRGVPARHILADSRLKTEVPGVLEGSKFWRIAREGLFRQSIYANWSIHIQLPLILNHVIPPLLILDEPNHYQEVISKPLRTGTC